MMEEVVMKQTCRYVKMVRRHHGEEHISQSELVEGTREIYLDNYGPPARETSKRIRLPWNQGD